MAHQQGVAAQKHLVLCGETHVVGDRACTAGLCGGPDTAFTATYPKHCKCGGLIHGHMHWYLINETYAGPEEICDKCGENLDPEDE